MYLNKTLKQISIIEILIISLISLIIILSCDKIFNIHLDNNLIYILIIFYIIYKLKDCKKDFINKIHNIFSKVSFKSILIIILINIFFSYGILYGFDLLIYTIKNPIKNILFTYSEISTIIIAPIAEELIFRGIFLNRINKFYSIHFSIIISSILFAILHPPGAIISAFVFGICMSIIYLKSNNILSPIFAHFLNNLISESIYNLDTYNFIFTNPLIIILFLSLAIISSYLLIIFLKIEWKKLS